MIGPLVQPVPALSDAEAARYARHLTLAGIGGEGQRRLRAARVLVIGAGGLGSPTLSYLAAAGVGHLTVIDDDTVEESNLQRQVIHRSEDVGRPKAESARDAVLRLDPAADITAIVGRLGADNALELFRAHDLVVDGADNFATRYLSNDAAELTGTPLIWGTLAQFSGQLSVFWPGRGPMLRDLFPDIPAADSVPSCAAGGVLGALVGQVGSMMSIEAIKALTGVGEPAIGRLIMVDSLAGTLRELRFTADPGRAPVTDLQEVAIACAALAPEDEPVPEVGAQALALELAVGRAAPRLVDVREPDEHVAGAITGDQLVPLSQVLAEGWSAVSPGASEPNPDIVLYCRSGGRSARALRALLAAPGAPAGVRLRSLAGGYLAWQAGPGAGSEPVKPAPVRAGIR